MKKRVWAIGAGMVVLFAGNQLVDAAPTYNNQTASQYADDLEEEAVQNGYVNRSYEYLYETSLPMTKIKREILDSQGNPVEIKDPNEPQFYLSFTDQFYIEKVYDQRPEMSWREPTHTVGQKLKYIKNRVGNKSQMLFPVIMTRTKANGTSMDWRKTNLLDSDYYKTGSNYPQGFMYAESNLDGANVKVKQFDYEKNTSNFRLLWNADTESMMYIVTEKGSSSDKVMVIRADMNEWNRYILVSGEMFYLGEESKRFWVLNQMTYEAMDPSFAFEVKPYKTYGVNREGNLKGFIIPSSKEKASVVIRTDTEDKAANWTVTSYPFNFSDTKYRFNVATGDETSKVENFLTGFSENSIYGKGYESDPDKQVPNVPITEGAMGGIRWNSSYSEYWFTGTGVTNSVKMKSDYKDMVAGDSIKLSYGFEPTTIYNKPTILPIKDVTKNDSEMLKTKYTWVDQSPDSDGGKILAYVGGSTEPIEFPYVKNGNTSEEEELELPADLFPAGKTTQVKLVLQDGLYDEPTVDPKEHTAERTFNVHNRRTVPIYYKTTGGSDIPVDESVIKRVYLMDDGSTKIKVPTTLTDKKYPLTSVSPKAKVTLEGNEVTINGGAELKDGVTISYKILEVKATVKFVNTQGKAILKDIKNGIPVEDYELGNLEVGKSLKEAINKAKEKQDKPLKVDYNGYTQLPAYKVLVNGVEVSDPTLIPETDFVIEFSYSGETSLVTVPNINFGKGNISNDSEMKQSLVGNNEESIVEMYDTENQTDSRITVSLENDIQNENKQVYGGEIRYQTGKTNETDLVLKKGTPVLVMKSTKDKHFNSISLKSSDETKPNMYMVQYPGNYEGAYGASLVWKLEPDTVKDAAK